MPGLPDPVPEAQRPGPGCGTSGGAGGELSGGKLAMSGKHCRDLATWQMGGGQYRVIRALDTL